MSVWETCPCHGEVSGWRGVRTTKVSVWRGVRIREVSIWRGSTVPSLKFIWVHGVLLNLTLLRQACLFCGFFDWTEYHPLKDSSTNSWIMANINATGFFLVNYDEENWYKLAMQLEEDHQVTIALLSVDKSWAGYLYGWLQWWTESEPMKSPYRSDANMLSYLWNGKIIRDQYQRINEH